MKWFYQLRMVYKILLPVTVVLVCVLSILAWQIQSTGSKIVQSVAERELAALGGEYSADVRRIIDAALNSTIAIATTVANLEDAAHPLNREQILTLLSRAQGETVVTIGAAFLPTPDDYLYVDTPGSDSDGQFHPQVSTAGVGILDKKYFAEAFFTVPEKSKKPYISDPYMWTNEEGTNVLMVTVGAPILVNDEFKGIIYLDFALAALGQMTNDIQVYSTGGISILAQDGGIMAHRDEDLILKKYFELERWREHKDLQVAIKAGEDFLEIIPINGKETFYFFHPFTFPQTGQSFYFVMIAPMDEVLAEVAQLTNVTLSASAFALFVLLIVIFIGVRSSIKPLATIVSLAGEVTQGNFDVKIDASKFGGEILELNNSLDAMLASLVENINKAEIMSKDAQEQTLKAQEAMREAEKARIAAEGAKREGMLAAATQLETVVTVISTASQELSSQVEKSEHASLEQASRIGETATAMEEMNSTVLEVARNAGSASEISAQTREQAESGARIVQGAVSGIERVQTVSLALKEDMNTLAEQAKSISEIMTVISDIADQTNLLALNAAIEAARAGDAGRGFAVVADEVRKLAEKTMTATTDVGNAITSIQASVDASIRQVDQTVDLIGTATEQSNQSGIALNEIVGLVDSTADQVHAIATASEEQSATSEEINRAISEINEIAEESARNMRAAADAVNDLTTQAHVLSQLIEEMKQA